MTQAYQNIYSMEKVEEQSTNSGSGSFTTDEKYIPGSIDCYIDGTLTHPTRITETSTTTYSVAPAPKVSSKVISRYNRLSILFVLFFLPLFSHAQIETYLVSPYGNIEFDSARVMTADSGIIYVTPTMLAGAGGIDSITFATNYRLDTTRTALDVRIGLRVKYTDTSTMLTPYLRKSDTTSMLGPYLHEVDTTAMLLPYLRKIDTTAMLLSYLREIDTTAMLTPYARKASPTFTGTVTIPTPFTLGATSVTTTGTQLNYLSSATGTTGTTSTNIVFSTSPSLTTPSLGVASATSLNTGTTLNGTIFAKSTNAVTLASSNHGLTVGGESNDHNLAVGEYGTGNGMQSRNNGAVGVVNINPLGGDVRFGIDAPAGVFNITGFHKGSGTGDYCNLELRNGAGTSAVDALFMRIMGTAWTTSGMNIQDAGVIGTGTNISGGLSIGTQASADVRFYTNNTLRWTLDNAGDLLATGKLRSNGGGVGYATGAGGTVTQITSRTTGVTLNKLCGNITMFSAAQAANALVTFTLTNSFIEAGDYLLVQHISATDGGAWNISVVCGAGSATINIRNVSTGSITSATPLRFFILKATTN